MRNKALLAIGFAAGYVAGARAGRARYDQLVGAAQDLWRSPQAREARATAAAKAEQAAPFIHHFDGHHANDHHTDDVDGAGQGSDAFDRAGGVRR